MPLLILRPAGAFGGPPADGKITWLATQALQYIHMVTETLQSDRFGSWRSWLRLSCQPTTNTTVLYSSRVSVSECSGVRVAVVIGAACSHDLSPSTYVHIMACTRGRRPLLFLFHTRYQVSDKIIPWYPTSTCVRRTDEEHSGILGHLCLRAPPSFANAGAAGVVLQHLRNTLVRLLLRYNMSCILLILPLLLL